MQHFRSAHDVPDIPALIDEALAFKTEPRREVRLGEGKTLGLIFLNPSTRTRLSSQIAAQNLGMNPVVFNAGSEGWALEFADGVPMNGTTVEHIREAAAVLGQYFDIIGLRSFPSLQSREEDENETVMNAYLKYSGKPMLSLESATLHPLQSLADLITIRERWLEKRKPRIALTWAPHMKPLPHCVANSFAQWVNAWGGADFTIAHPEGYELDEQYTRGAYITNNQQEALEGADFVYVKNWSSMEPYGTVLPGNLPWMLTTDKLDADTRVMHCLPVRRDLELGADVLDSAHSIVVQQAGNRVWAAQAVLAQMLKVL
jgi:N-succinyl-L-ornithine transcarbamylase